MPVVIALPDGYQYVLGAVLSTSFALVGQTFIVGKLRRKAQVKYPQLYADTAVAEKNPDAFLFNCAQRVHQNTLENIPIIVTTTLISGLRYPHFAASACAYWVLSRVAYTRGYLSGDPAKRVNIFSGLGMLSLLSMLGVSTYHVGSLICSGL